MIAEFEDKSEDKLCDRVSAIGRDVGNRNPAFPCTVAVDDIIASREQLNKL